MSLRLQTVKFTTREVRITREMKLPEFVLSVRGAVATIAREERVTHQAVSAILHGKKKSRRISSAIERWIERELKRRAA